MTTKWSVLDCFKIAGTKSSPHKMDVVSKSIQTKNVNGRFLLQNGYSHMFIYSTWSLSTF